MLNISREYHHNLNTAAYLFISRCARLWRRWIFHREWDLRAVPICALFCHLPICNKSSLLLSRSPHLPPSLPPAPFPQVGIQLGAGAISFSATACLPQSFVKKKEKKEIKKNVRAVPLEKIADSWERYIKKNKEREERDGNSGDLTTKRGGGSPEVLSEEIRAWPVMGDTIEQNMYWRQRLCLLPVPFQWITPLHPLPPAF